MEDIDKAIFKRKFAAFNPSVRKLERQKKKKSKDTASKKLIKLRLNISERKKQTNKTKGHFENKK